MKENAIKEKLVKFIRDTDTRIVKYVDNEDFTGNDFALVISSHNAELFLDTFQGICSFGDAVLRNGKITVWLKDFCNGHGFSAEQIYQQFN